MRATNPELWNSWKAQLFEGLYKMTKQALRRGLATPIDKDELVTQRQQEARELLRRDGMEDAAIDSAWRCLRTNISCAAGPMRSIHIRDCWPAGISDRTISSST